MKNERLEKIARGVAHPFISLLPNQESIHKKLEWYNPIIGILETSSLEILTPIVYVSMNPSPANLLIGGIIAIDGMWRINNLMDEPPPSENPPKKYLGTNFLEIPYNIYKKIRKK
jgi:hypothetical protein